ncbi:MAG: hypothetical protein JO041_09235 [Acidobacteria bacterium]|nr:hypothetical protein [Acidobacteriota bacterium]
MPRKTSGGAVSNQGVGTAPADFTRVVNDLQQKVDEAHRRVDEIHRRAERLHMQVKELRRETARSTPSPRRTRSRTK